MLAIDRRHRDAEEVKGDDSHPPLRPALKRLQSDNSERGKRIEELEKELLQLRKRQQLDHSAALLFKGNFFQGIVAESKMKEAQRDVLKWENNDARVEALFDLLSH